MSVGLSGNLKDFGIADVFQLIGQQRKTGVLELVSSATRVQLSFDEGSVVTAAPAVGRATDADPVGEMMVRCGVLTRDQAREAQTACRASAQTLVNEVVERGWANLDEARAVEDLLTRNTIFDVLRWETGSFDFRATDVDHDRERSTLLGAEQILMDGLRMVDEWQAFGHLVPSETDVFQRVGRFDSYRDKATDISTDQLERARRLFSLVDGRLSARRVIDLSRLGNFDGTRILAELREAGLIKPLHPEGVRQLRRHTRATGGSRGAGLRRAGVAFATVLPLAFLATMAFLSHDRVAPTENPGRIEVRSLERLREAQATRRLRSAVDVYRLVEGEWPASLEDVARRGIVPTTALAAPLARPYYSARRADGIVLLAPEH